MRVAHTDGNGHEDRHVGGNGSANGEENGEEGGRERDRAGESTK